MIFLHLLSGQFGLHCMFYYSCIHQVTATLASPDDLFGELGAGACMSAATSGLGVSGIGNRKKGSPVYMAPWHGYDEMTEMRS